jgi:hypothetical protein
VIGLIPKVLILDTLVALLLRTECCRIRAEGIMAGLAVKG